ncbi:MAG: SDR family NAD(P)-dependent oxidoreductase [Planctomycetota bacterium]
MSTPALFSVHATSFQELADAAERLLAGAAPAAPALASPTLGAPSLGGATLAVRAADPAELRAQLERAVELLRRGAAPERGAGIHFTPTPCGAAGLACLFPGQGSQRVGMSRALEEALPGFAAALERGDALARAELGRSLARDFLRATPPDPALQAELTRTEHAQPAVGLVDLAAAEALVELGVAPGLVAGHSYGELVALQRGGAYDPAELFALSRERGRLLGGAAERVPGRMLALRAAPARAAELARDLPGVAVPANLNAPDQTVVSGELAAIEALAARCEAEGVSARPVPTTCAFHSPLMQPVADEWRAFLAGRALRAPRAEQVVSSLDARPYPPDPEAVRAALAEQVTGPVRWVETVLALWERGARLFLETGPGQVLTGLTRKILRGRPHLALALDPPPGVAPRAHLLEVWGWLLAHGVLADAGPFSASFARPAPARSAAAGGALPRPALPPPPDAGDATTAGFLASGRAALEAFFEQQERLLARHAATLSPPARAAHIHELLTTGEALVRELLSVQEAALARLGGASPALGGGPLGASAAPGEVPAGALVAEDEEGVATWLRGELCRITGFPPEAVTRESQFEADLGLDSITLIEVWVALQERFPAVAGDEEQLRKLRTVGALIDFAQGQAPRAETGPAALAPGPARTPGALGAHAAAGARADAGAGAGGDAAAGARGDAAAGARGDAVAEAPRAHHAAAPRVSVARSGGAGGSDSPEGGRAQARPAGGLARPQASEHERLLAALRERLSADFGLEAAELRDDADLEEDLGVDAFSRQVLLQRALADAPRYRLAGRALLEASTLGELRELLARLDPAVAPAGPDPLRRFRPREVPTPPGAPEEVAASATLVAGPAELLSGTAPPQALALTVADGRWELAGGEAARVDLSDVAGLAGVLRQRLGPGAIDLVFLAAGPAPSVAEALERGAVALFLLAKALRAAGLAPARLTVLGDDGSPGWAAARGVARALAREWPEVACRSLWLAGGATPARLAEAVALAPRLPREHDLRLGASGEVTRRELLETGPLPEGWPLAPGEAVLVVGAGGGIGSAVALALAARGARVACLGRTEWPASSPYPEVAAEDDAELKRRIYADLRASGAPAHPAAIQARFRIARRQRALLALAAGVEAAGGTFSYAAADGRDPGAVRAAVEALRAEGPIRGLVFAAGVTQDELLGQKSAETFRRVLNTKAIACAALREALRDEPLRFALLLSSLAAHAGTAGQTDYAAANEATNAIAAAWAREVDYPVRALLFSVWGDAGLASSALLRQMERRGLAAIATEEGVAAILAEAGAAGEGPWALYAPQSTLRFALEGGA